MLSVIKNAWKVPDIRKKILFTLFVVVIFRMGSQIPVPYIDAAKWSAWMDTQAQGSLLGYFSMLSGEAFSQSTLFALGVSPYITASIVVQLLTIAIPYLERLAKQGPEGQKKLAFYTRIATMILAILTGYGYYATIRANGFVTNRDFFPGLVIVACYTAGACIVTWIGEKIDESGIGNGISIILFANICSSLAFRMISVFSFITEPTEWYWVIIALVVMLALITFVVFISDSERRIPIQYAKRQVGRRMYGGNSTYLPIKILMNGVMPVIFASAIVSLPATLGMMIPALGTWVRNNFSTSFNNGGWAYVILMVVFTIAFAYFYTTISFNANEVANNLRKNGGTVLGYRPGKPTADYITKVLNRIVLIGAVCLSVISVFPIILSWTGSSALNLIVFGGTSLIIVVGVALETVHSLESELMMRHYKGFLG